MIVMNAIFEHPHKHPISAEEYLRMGQAGVFAPDARLELIEGEIIEMAPIHPPHAGRVNMSSASQAPMDSVRVFPRGLATGSLVPRYRRSPSR